MHFSSRVAQSTGSPVRAQCWVPAYADLDVYYDHKIPSLNAPHLRPHFLLPNFTTPEAQTEPQAQSKTLRGIGGKSKSGWGKQHNADTDKLSSAQGAASCRHKMGQKL